jgi:hypothetical protein
MTPAGKNRRDALLSELESIRAMLEEDAHSDNIPLLIPEDHGSAADHIPVLSVIANAEIINTATVAAASPATDPLQAIRQAAAKVVANTGRHRVSQETAPLSQVEPPPEKAPPKSTPPKPTLPVAQPAANEREKLVDDIVRGALPRMEALLRELVQEALLQEKLRGGKR